MPTMDQVLGQLIDQVRQHVDEVRDPQYKLMLRLMEGVLISHQAIDIRLTTIEGHLRMLRYQS